MFMTLVELLQKITMDNPKIIDIYIPDEDAQKFILFKKYFDVFSILLEKGVFNQKSASVHLNFDHLGTLQTIQREDMMYSRKFASK